MASKKILQEAIKHLEAANDKLFKKINNTNDKNKQMQYKDEIQQNNSMILDYKYRIKNE